MTYQALKVLACSLGLLICLASCQRDATITILGDGTKPEFVAEASGGKTCVTSIFVYPYGADDRNVQPLWSIGLIFGRGDSDCRDRLVYGETPQGYATDNAPKPLVAGTRYRVQMHGAGWTVTKDWTPK
jgi:hypothetical protein